jgi:LEA14-like dessication related protein
MADDLEDKVAAMNISERVLKPEDEEDGKNVSGGGGGEDGVGGGVLAFFKEIGDSIESAPEANVSDFHLPSITLKQAEVIISVLITNPNPVPIPLLEIVYSMESEGRHLCSGDIPDAGTVHAHGSETIKIPILLIYKDIVETFEEIKPGHVIPYLLKVIMYCCFHWRLQATFAS